MTGAYLAEGLATDLMVDLPATAIDLDTGVAAFFVVGFAVDFLTVDFGFADFLLWISVFFRDRVLRDGLAS